MINDNKLGV